MPTIRMSGLSKNVITNELPAKAHVIKAVAKIGKSENTVPHNKEPVVSIAHRKAGKCFLGELIEDGGAPAIFLEKKKSIVLHNKCPYIRFVDNTFPLLTL